MRLNPDDRWLRSTSGQGLTDDSEVPIPLPGAPLNPGAPEGDAPILTRLEEVPAPASLTPSHQIGSVGRADIGSVYAVATPSSSAQPRLLPTSLTGFSSFSNRMGEKSEEVSENTTTLPRPSHVDTLTSFGPASPFSHQDSTFRTPSALRSSGSLLSRNSSILWDKIPKVKNAVGTRELGIDFDGNDGNDADAKFRLAWQAYGASIISSAAFEITLILVISLNILVMALEDQYEGLERGYKLDFAGMESPAAERWPQAEEFFLISEWVFGVIFTAELLVKLAVFERRFFQEAWNWLDAVIVLGFLVDRLGSLELLVSPTLLRLSRLFRLLRITRLTRSMRAFDDFHLITAALSQSVSATFYACLLLFMLQVIVALAIQHSLAAYLVNTHHPAEARHLVYEYYGTFTRAFLTLFHLTLGNWPDAVRVLTEHVSEWWCPPLLVYVLCVSFAFIRVIMSVFTSMTLFVYNFDDRLLMRQQERATTLHLGKMTKLFQAADSDGNGTLDLHEFCKVFEDYSVHRWLGAMEFEFSLFGNTAEALFRLLDDGDGVLTASELVQGVAMNKGLARSANLAVLMTECKDNAALLEEILLTLDRVRRPRQSQKRKNGPRSPATSTCSSGVKENMTPSADVHVEGKATACTAPLKDGVRGLPHGATTSKLEYGSTSHVQTRRASTGAMQSPCEGTKESPDQLRSGRRASTSATMPDGSAAAVGGTPQSSLPRSLSRRRSSTFRLRSMTDVAMEGHSEVAAKIFIAEYVKPSSASSLTAEVSSDETASHFGWWDSFQALTNSVQLEGFFIVVLLLYSLISALDAQYEGLQVGYEIGYAGMSRPADEVWPGARDVLDALQIVLGVIFILESLLHLLGGRRAFRESPWIVLDLVATCAWILELIPPVEMPIQVSLVRLVRITRLSRLMVLVQLSSRFSTLQFIWAAVRGSVLALFWTSCTFLLGLLMAGLTVHALLEPRFADESEDASGRWALFVYFGSFSKLIITVFELTLANWIPAARALVEEGGEWFMLYAIGHKVIYGFCIFTVITAVFLQETFMIAKDDNAVQHNMRSAAARENRKKMMRLFKYADTDGSGCIDLEEFKVIMRAKGVSTWMAAMGLQMTDVEAVFKIIDDGDGRLTAGELMDGIGHMKGSAKSIDMHMLHLHITQLRERLKELDSNLKDPTVESILRTGLDARRKPHNQSLLEEDSEFMV